MRKEKVSLMTFTFRSQYLARQTKVNILLPTGACEESLERNQPPFKTMWLLHGKTDDCDTWLRNSIIETLSRQYGMALIMPDAGNSFYTNMVYGADYYSYIVEELPAVLGKLLPLSMKKQDSFIAGFSMGGYGALKIGLRNPQNFAAIGCFSSAVDIVDIVRTTTEHQHQLDAPDAAAACLKANKDYAICRHQAEYDMRNLQGVFGDKLQSLGGSQEDIFHLLTTATAQKKAVPIFATCGTEDFLFDMNERFAKHAQSIAADCTYRSWDGGHEWNFWNQSIQAYFDYLADKKLL